MRRKMFAAYVRKILLCVRLEVWILSTSMPTKRTRAVEFLLEEQDDRCYKCRKTLSEDDAIDVDHKTRLADGGTDDISNKCVLCVPCHREKTRRENVRASTFRTDSIVQNINDVIRKMQMKPPIQTAQRYSLEQIRGWYVDGKLKNAECNRHPVWDMHKKHAFILTILSGGVVPPIFVNKLTRRGERHIYDGGNRIHALMSFMDGSLHVQFRIGRKSLLGCYKRCCVPGSHTCEPLDDDNVRRLHSIMIDVFEWDNLSTNDATECAVHLNEGTPLCMGEKLKLITGRDTPRAKMLKYLYESKDFQSIISRERDREIKILALFLRSIISPDLTYSSNLTSNLGPLQHFYTSEDYVDHSHIESAENILSRANELLADRTRSQRKMLVCLIGLAGKFDVRAALNDSDVETSSITVEKLLDRYKLVGDKEPVAEPAL